MRWSEQHPLDWLATWQLIEDKYGTGEACPQGAGVPFNIDAKLNGAYIALGLLYGEGDFEKTMKISTRAGQDSDCNPASAAGVLGVVLGFKAIPGKYKQGIDAIVDKTFAYTDYSFRSIVESSRDRAIAVVVANGGRMEGSELHVPVQAPAHAELEIWDDYGRLHERIRVDDQRCAFSGAWKLETIEFWGFRWLTNNADLAGASVEITFEGTGVIVTAAHRPDGGMVEVVLDGMSQGVFDTFSEEDTELPLQYTVKLDEAVWHRFGLREGSHSLQLRVTGEPYRRPGVISGGTRFSMQDVVVFR